MLHKLCSELHTETSPMPFKVSDTFIEENQVVAVLTGGTEAQFVDLVKQKKIDLKRPVYLLVSGYSNSLAAAFEILSFIRQRNGIAKVMTHAKDTVFPDVSETDSLTRTPLEKVLKNEKKQRLGIIGKPSDWLIASQVDYKQVLKEMNIELVDIPIEEVSSLGEVDPGMPGALAIYDRVKELIAKYKLDGVTLRCFDLLTTVKNTGCIAMSKLNCKKLTGETGFMVNPARIQPDGQILIAHCTIPLNMTEKHEYTTHFESGIGVAIHGDLPAGDYTLVKLSGDLKRLLAVNVTLTRCQYEQNLCRTQAWIQTTPIVSQYFMTSPIANHHLLIKGHHAAKFWRE